jgi:hypothetical protein
MVGISSVGFAFGTVVTNGISKEFWAKLDWKMSFGTRCFSSYPFWSSMWKLKLWTSCALSSLSSCEKEESGIIGV